MESEYGGVLKSLDNKEEIGSVDFKVTKKPFPVSQLMSIMLGDFRLYMRASSSARVWLGVDDSGKVEGVEVEEGSWDINDFEEYFVKFFPPLPPNSIRLQRFSSETGRDVLCLESQLSEKSYSFYFSPEDFYSMEAMEPPKKISPADVWLRLRPQIGWATTNLLRNPLEIIVRKGWDRSDVPIDSLPRSYNDLPPLSDPSCVVYLLFISIENALQMAAFIENTLREHPLRVVCVTEKGSLVVELLQRLSRSLDWRESLDIVDVLQPSTFKTIIPPIPTAIAAMFKSPNPSCRNFVVKEVTEEAAQQISEGSLTLEFPPAAIARFSQHISTAKHIRRLLGCKKVSILKVGKKFCSSGATALLLGVYELLKDDEVSREFLSSNLAQNREEIQDFLGTIQQPWVFFCDDTLGIADADLRILSEMKVPHAVVFVVVTRSHQRVDILVSPFLKVVEDVDAFVTLLIQLFPKSQSSLEKVSTRAQSGNDAECHIFNFLFAALANKAVPIRSWIKEQMTTFPASSQGVIDDIAFREIFLPNSPHLKAVPIKRFDPPPTFFPGSLIETDHTSVKFWRPWFAAFYLEERHNISFAFTDIPSSASVTKIQDLFLSVLDKENGRKQQEEIFFNAVLKRRGTGVAFAPLVTFVFRRLQERPKEADNFVAFLESRGSYFPSKYENGPHVTMMVSRLYYSLVLSDQAVQKADEAYADAKSRGWNLSQFATNLGRVQSPKNWQVADEKFREGIRADPTSKVTLALAFANIRRAGRREQQTYLAYWRKFDKDNLYSKMEYFPEERTQATAADFFFDDE